MYIGEIFKKTFLSCHHGLFGLDVTNLPWSNYDETPPLPLITWVAVSRCPLQFFLTRTFKFSCAENASIDIAKAVVIEQTNRPILDQWFRK